MGTPDRKSVAWKVGDGEHAVIVFSHHFFEARRLGAERLELGGDDESCMCERDPRFDKYVATGMSVSDYLSEGWWWTCSWCEHRVAEDGCSRCDVETADEDEPTGLVPPLIDDAAEQVWCSASCRDADLAFREERKARKARLIAETHRRWPGVTDVMVWDNCIDFKFPGGTGRASWRHPHQTLEVSVPRCDLAAWFEFSGRSRSA